MKAPRPESPRLGLAALLVALAANAAPALVDPSLQPNHILDRYTTVIGGKITRVDMEKNLVTFQVTHQIIGKFAPTEVTVEVPPAAPAEGGEAAAAGADDAGESLLDVAETGGVVVGFVGKRRGNKSELLLYAGHVFHAGRLKDLNDLSRWTWRAGLGLNAAESMHGTFNGTPEQLLAMMLDAAEGRYFFPPYPFVKFQDDRIVARIDKPWRGVAIQDLDGDGRPDIAATSDAGVRVFLQTAPLKFEDRTRELGLEGVKASSVSVADATADGRPDLLLDGAVYWRTDTGFNASKLLPEKANQGVKSAAFVDLNADGYPDVVVSHVNGGLAAYLNPGGKVHGAVFEDATAKLGLDQPESGAGQTGFFFPGDLNQDGRIDLFYAVGKGLLLVQDGQGRFAPRPQPYDFDFKTADGPGLTGAGMFAPQWRPDRFDLVSCSDINLRLATEEGGKLRDVTGAGNELQLGVARQIAVLAEDLNMDGRVDLLTITREADAGSNFHSNRGYGSYMKDDLYAQSARYDAFPGDGFGKGAWGVTAGDVNGDGANDLLLAGLDGNLRLLVNDTLSLRVPREDSQPYELVLTKAVIVSVRVRGNRGVTNAVVRLADDKGRVVGQRMLGALVLTGCAGPDTVNLAVPFPGRMTLSVRYSDGHTVTKPLELGQDRHVPVDVTR